MTSTAFLRECLCVRHDPGAADTLRAKARNLEDSWESVQAAIEAERVAPLMHRAVGGLGIVPPAMEDVLRQTYRLTLLRTLLLLHELGRCLRQLAAAHVPVIVLKGMALAETVYCSLSLRPMADVDLLVHRRDLESARRVLEELGYGLTRAETHPGVLFEHENELVFFKQGRDAAAVDLHWSLFDSPYYQRRITLDWFWQTAQPVLIAGVPALILGPEALIIHLCGHLALHHRGTGLLWWHDIVEVVAFHREGIDWTELLSRTQQYGLLLPVHAVLTRAAEEWRAQVPPAVLKVLSSQRPSRAERRVFARLSVEESAGQRFWTDLTSMRSWRQRLRFARTNLFPSAAYMRRRYRISNPLLLPLYYPYRWLRGLRGPR